MPRLWPGETCFLLGGGPSLAHVPIERLQGRRTIAVNNAYKLAPWFDVCYWADCRWYDWHRDALRTWPGLKVSSCENHHGIPDVRLIRRRYQPFGLERDPSMIAWNLSSGGGAVNLALHFGAKRVVLLGYDMRKVSGENNWHQDHPLASRSRDPYRKFLIPFPEIARDAAAFGLEIVNATPGSALTLFPMVSLEEELASVHAHSHGL